MADSGGGHNRVEASLNRARPRFASIAHSSLLGSIIILYDQAGDLLRAASRAVDRKDYSTVRDTRPRRRRSPHA